MPEMPPVLSVKEAAGYLGVSSWTVYEYCRQGVIPHRRIGRRILIHSDALASWFRDGEQDQRGGAPAGSPAGAGCGLTGAGQAGGFRASGG